MTAYRAGSNAASDALSRIRGALPKPTYNANVPTSTVTWSDNGAGGSFEVSGANNYIAVYTPKNLTQAVVITATDNTNSKNISLTVTATLPLQPQVQFENELDIETKVKFARDMTPYFREDGTEQIGWTLGYDNRLTDAKAEMFTFWRGHRKVVPFYVIDVEGDLMNLVYFTSSIKSVFSGDGRWALAAGVRGAFTDTSAP